MLMLASRTLFIIFDCFKLAYYAEAKDSRSRQYERTRRNKHTHTQLNNRKRYRYLCGVAQRFKEEKKRAKRMAPIPGRLVV